MYAYSEADLEQYEFVVSKELVYIGETTVGGICL